MISIFWRQSEYIIWGLTLIENEGRCIMMRNIVQQQFAEPVHRVEWNCLYKVEALLQ